MMSIPQDRMDQLLKRFSMIESQMASNPDSDTYVKLASEYSELETVVAKIRDLIAARSEADDLKSMLNDASTDKDMRELAEAELPEINERIEALEQEIQVLLLPKDVADERNAILEIRAGTGGSEAALFGGDLFRMYERYA
ncbi:MAG: PCRF domain-containing protein, partial [Pyrinomonadaceae bacterium]